MKERTLEIAETWLVHMFGDERPERDRIKALLTAGEHEWRGSRYRIVRDAIPADAVMSIPIENKCHLDHRVWSYGVLSDDFTDADPSWIAPVGEHICGGAV